MHCELLTIRMDLTRPPPCRHTFCLSPAPRQQGSPTPGPSLLQQAPLLLAGTSFTQGDHQLIGVAKKTKKEVVDFPCKRVQQL